MDEKQRLAAADAAAAAPLPPPPAYATIHVSSTALEALEAPAPLPGWIRRLPLTLPLTHVAVAVPVALYGARSLPEAVLLAAATSFVLVCASTKAVARTTRRDPVARTAAARRLVLAAFVTLLWPLIALLVVAPVGRPLGCTMHRLRGAHHHHRLHRVHHLGGARPHRHHRHHHDAAAPAIDVVPQAEVPDLSVVLSSKGPRVLQPGDGHAPARILPTDAPVVVSSQGVKILAEGDPSERVMAESVDAQL